MIDLSLVYVDVLLFAGLLSTLLAIFVWRRQNTPGSLSLALTIFAVMVWTFFGAIEGSASNMATKIFWSKVQYIGIVNVTPFFLLFVLTYTGRLKQPAKSKIWLMWLIPVFVLISVWTNEWHHLVWTGFSPIDSSSKVMTYHHGPIFWLTMGYSFLVVFIIFIILLNEFRKTTHTKYRWQIAMIMLADFSPVIGSLVYLTGVNPIPGLDWTPVGGFMAILLLTISVFSFGFMDLLPVAREILLEQMEIGMLVSDTKHRIVDLNPAMIKLFEPKELAIGMPVEKFFKSIGIEQDIFPNLNQPFIIELDEIGKDVKYIEFKLTQLFRDKIILGWLGSFRDISEQKRSSMEIQSINSDLNAKLTQIEILKKELEEQTIRDPLTNVYNRRFFDETFEKEIARSKRRGKPLCITMIDIDHFKRVNDQYGHAVGDQVLKNFGALLLSKTRKGDVVCRYGGEEFIILLTDADHVQTLNRLNEIREDFRNMCLQDATLKMDVTISLGVACFPHHGNDSRDLILKADKALYAAKENGRNQVAIAN